MNTVQVAHIDSLGVVYTGAVLLTYSKLFVVPGSMSGLINSMHPP